MSLIEKLDNNKLWVSFRRIVISAKVFIHRTGSWIALINSGMLLYLVIGYESRQYIVPIVGGTVILLTLLGYIEDKIGFHREEHLLSQRRNPHLTEIRMMMKKLLEHHDIEYKGASDMTKDSPKRIKNE